MVFWFCEGRALPCGALSLLYWGCQGVSEVVKVQNGDRKDKSKDGLKRAVSHERVSFEQKTGNGKYGLRPVESYELVRFE